MSNAWRPKGKPPVDICRIRTERVREMSGRQLDKVRRRIGAISTLPKATRNRTDPHHGNYLLAHLIFNVIGSRMSEIDDKRVDEAYRKNYGTEPKPNREIKKHYRRSVDESEMRIWDEQQRRGCKLASADAPARDVARDAYAAKQPQPVDLMNKIRGRRKAKIR